MERLVVRALMWGAWLSMGQLIWAVEPGTDELLEAHRFAAAKFQGVEGLRRPTAGLRVLTTDPPFSFKYDGSSSSEFLKTWERHCQTQEMDALRTQYTLQLTDPRTGLLVRCVAVEYHDFPTVEWTVYLKNTGSSDTPILEDVQAIDLRLERDAEGEFTLHEHTGDNCSPDSYRPHEFPLYPGTQQAVASPTGRPTTGALPYFNLEWPGAGVIVVVGWPGQWQAKFARDAGHGVVVTAGQELTRFKLHPGEEVRTPLMVLQFWRGDRIRAQNIWRRWMLAHNSPRPAGKSQPPILAACSMAYFQDGAGYNEGGERQFIDGFLHAGVNLDHWWIDAGWFEGGDVSWWDSVGNWEPDRERFPRGLKAVSDHAHARGLKMIVWFEPERVAAGTWLAENHPQWIHGGSKGGLLNLGCQEARIWLTDHIDKLLSEQQIDVYRQDFNIEPLSYWRSADEPDRQGITEIRHVEGYLAFWDELLRRHPDLLIDSCASGGRRNDLETLRRALPLLRTDHHANRAFATDNQSITYGLSFWMPFYGTGLHYDPVDFSYVARSYFCPSYTLGCDVRRDDVDWIRVRKSVDEWREVAPCMLGDYYPLTPYSLEPTPWMAWQFDLPAERRGVVQLFRRPESPRQMATFPLQALDPRATYEVIDLDSPAERKQVAGRELVEQGLSVTLSHRPSSAVVLYRQVAVPLGPPAWPSQ